MLMPSLNSVLQVDSDVTARLHPRLHISSQRSVTHLACNATANIAVTLHQLDASNTVHLLLQRIQADPKNTLKAYWPKIQSFLLWKCQRRIECIFNPQQRADAAADQERANPELHSRDCLVDSCDYLAFLSAVEQGRAGLGMNSRGKCLWLIWL